MGCDMHTHLERQTDAGWVNVSLHRFDYCRSYTLFAELGMTYRRPEVGACIGDLRGIPDDAAATTREAYEGDCDSVGAHSPGWWTIDEIRSSLPLDLELCQDQQRFHFLRRLEAAIGEPLRGTDRIVFWFDN